MKLRNLFMLIGISISFLSAMGQATSLTIDNQTPGWLSSKIAYGDQQTVQNLKVTGFINAEDLKFIGRLMGKYSLTGCIDLENVDIIGETSSKDNVMPEKAFKIGSGGGEEIYVPGGLTISHIKLPLSITSSNNCMGSEMKVDTITCGGEKMPSVKGINLYGSLNTKTRHLILREGVTEIPNDAFRNEDALESNNFIFSSVEFPSTLKRIGKSAFLKNYALKNLKLPNQLAEIDKEAFYLSGYKPDTLIVPDSVKVFNTRAFNIPKVVIFGEHIESIKNEYSTYNNSFGTYSYNDHWDYNMNLTIIIKNINPPYFGYQSDKCLQKSTIYVPKISIDAYKKANVWKNAMLILPIPVDVTSISMTGASTMKVGQTSQMEAVAYPLDADDRTILWETSNSEIATVSQSGVVTAISQGEVTIKASSLSNPNIFKECKITIVQPVTSISISKSELELNVGETGELNVNIYPTNATNKSVVWKSDDEKIASVSQNGIVKAMNPGNTIIRVNSCDDESIQAQCVVKVNQPVSSITLDESSIVLKSLGETKQLTSTVHPDDASNKNISWYSSNSNVCLVSPRGLVTAVGEGTSVVVATTEDGGFTASCVVKVNFNTVTTIELNKTELTLHPEDSEQLTVTAMPEELIGKSVTWSSSDDYVVTVDKNGLVQANKVGSAKIIAMIGDLFAICQVTVSPVLADSISLNNDVLSLKIGKSEQLIATILPSNTTNKTLLWESSNEAVATVNNNGLVEILSEGVTTISASTTDGTMLKASCTLNATSAIQEVYADGSNIAIETLNGDIIINGANTDSVVYVFDAVGTMVYKGYDRRISTANHGIYIVIIENKHSKIVI